MASPRERRLPPPSFRMENPFSVKVLQVFTGFGIGVGRPIYLGMIPGLQQVMSATRGATDAFSGVTRHANSALRTSGLRNIEAGIGCGVGIGHGFGIVIALKPRLLHEIQSFVGAEGYPCGSSASNLMAGSLSSNQQTRNGMSMDLDANTAERNFNNTTSNEMSRAQPTHVLHAQHVAPPEELTGSRTEKVISNFLQSPLFKTDSKMEFRNASGDLHGMDNVLQLVSSVMMGLFGFRPGKVAWQASRLGVRFRTPGTVMAACQGSIQTSPMCLILPVIKHQRIIEELQEENENLRQILFEELKISPTKLQANRRHGVSAYYPCSDCFECRRRSRRTTK